MSLYLSFSLPPPPFLPPLRPPASPSPLRPSASSYALHPLASPSHYVSVCSSLFLSSTFYCPLLPSGFSFPLPPSPSSLYIHLSASTSTSLHFPSILSYLCLHILPQYLHLPLPPNLPLPLFPPYLCILFPLTFRPTFFLLPLFSVCHLRVKKMSSMPLKIPFILMPASWKTE